MKLDFVTLLFGKEIYVVVLFSGNEQIIIMLHYGDVRAKFCFDEAMRDALRW